MRNYGNVPCHKFAFAKGAFRNTSPSTPDRKHVGAQSVPGSPNQHRFCRYHYLFGITANSWPTWFGKNSFVPSGTRSIRKNTHAKCTYSGEVAIDRAHGRMSAFPLPLFVQACVIARVHFPPEAGGLSTWTPRMATTIGTKLPAAGPPISFPGLKPHNICGPIHPGFGRPPCGSAQSFRNSGSK